MPKKLIQPLTAPVIRAKTATFFREVAEMMVVVADLQLSTPMTGVTYWPQPAEWEVQELVRQCILTYITTAEIWNGPIDPLFPLLLAEMLETHDLHTPLF